MPQVTFSDSQPSETEYFEAFNKYNGLNSWIILVFILKCSIHYCMGFQKHIFENPEAIDYFRLHFLVTNNSVFGKRILSSSQCKEETQSLLKYKISAECEKKELAFDMKMLENIGITFGAVTGGILADLFGRRITSVYWSTLWTIISTVLVFLPNLDIFRWCYMISVLCSEAIFVVTFVNFGEIVNKRIRILTIFTLHGSSVSALFSKPFLSRITEFKYVAIFTAVSLSTSIFVCFYIPESPRWLLTKDKKRESFQLLEEVTGITYQSEVEGAKPANRLKTLYKMFEFLVRKKWKYLSIVCLLVTVSTINNSCAKTKILMDRVTKLDQGFVIFTTQIASFLFIIPIYIFMGKRYGLLLIYCLIATISLVALVIFGKSKEIFYTRFSISLTSSTLNLLFLYILDIFPTFIRGTVFGISLSVFGLSYGIGGVVVHEVKNFSGINYYMTCFLMGILGPMVLLLPSTSRIDLPNYKLEM